MEKLIIDVANEKIFLMLINEDNIHKVELENSKINYERLSILINEFLEKHKKNLNNISQIYVNRGPGSFAGIRNSLSTVKAINLVNNTDYFCFSFNDFKNENDVKYENIPDLCKKYKIKKNLINPDYSG
ncbi:peptidase M22 [Candidatus Pelagibacter sp.]|uniref:peptidase M22 n=1 Tax=Candidatus Pelagibacter sp. TaxID=2024849 RepID=UPI003F8763FF